MLNAVNGMSKCKAPREDGLQAEVFQLGGAEACKALERLFKKYWDTPAEIPQDFKDSIVLMLFKNKGGREDPNNYRGISLLSVCGKILASILQKRLMKVVGETVSETQCGFRPSRSTEQAIFTLLRLQEVHKLHDKSLCAVFIDFAKAFDSVSREALWLMLEKRGAPKPLIHVLISLHQGSRAFLKKANGNISKESIPLERGVRQGCKVAPTLFIIFLDCCLELAKWKSCGSTQLILKRSNPYTRPDLENIPEECHCDYADDIVLWAEGEQRIAFLQNKLDALNDACKPLGLCINIAKQSQ
jgi:hypothetical protein